MTSSITKVLFLLVSLSIFNIAYATTKEAPNMARFDNYMACAKQMMQVKPVDRAGEIANIRQFAICIGNSDDVMMQRMSVCMQTLANKMEPYIDNPQAINQQLIAREIEDCMKGISQ